MIGVQGSEVLKPIKEALNMKFKSSIRYNQRAERITVNHLVVGVDIAKDTHVARAVNFRGIEQGRPIHFPNNTTGFERLLSWIRTNQRAFQLNQVIVGLESTGHYHFNLADWLHHKGIEVVLVNPMVTKRNKENRDNRPSKSDDKDAVVIAEAVSRAFYSDIVRHEAIYGKLRAAVNEREYWSEQRASLSNRIQRALDLVFPEFTSVFQDWSCERGLATLQAFTLPSEIASLSVEQIIDGWRDPERGAMKRAGGVRGRQKAAELLAAARRSIGSTDAREEFKRELLRLVEAYHMATRYMQTLEQEIEQLLKQVPVEWMSSVGLSPLFIAVILANTGDLSQYEHGQQVLALAGLSLAEDTSGKRKGQMVISKRGRRQLRKYLYLAVMNLVANTPAFRAWHEHNVKNLKMKKQRSIFKLIGKLARILVGMARTGDTFNPDKASPLPARAA